MSTKTTKLTPTQKRVIKLLRRYPDNTYRAIAKAASVHESTVGDIARKFGLQRRSIPTSILRDLEVEPVSLIKPESLPKYTGRGREDARTRKRRADIAKDVTAQTDTLSVLAEDDSIKVLKEVAGNPFASQTTHKKLLANKVWRRYLAQSSKDNKLDKHLLTKLSTDASHSVKKAVAGNRYTPSKVLARMVTNEYNDDEEHDGILEILAQNPSTPDKAMMKLARHPSWFVCRTVASHTSTPSALMFLSSHEDPDVVGNVARNRHTPKEKIIELADHESWGMRMNVARNRGAPQEVLYKLSTDKIFIVRMKVAGNPSTPPELISKLAREITPPYLCSKVLKNLEKFTTQNSSIKSDEFKKMADGMSELLKEHQEIQQHAASNPSAPHDLLEELSKSDHKWVRYTAIETLKEIA